MSLAYPSYADAEARPFGVNAFAIQPISGTKEIPGETEGTKTEEFVDEPYSYTQAGGAPWGLKTTIEFTSEEFLNHFKRRIVTPTRDPKDIIVELPTGLLGDPLALPRCSLIDIHASLKCPSATQVGEYRVRWHGGKEEVNAIVNVTPEAGQSAEFALENEIHITPVITAHIVRTSSGYGLAVASNKIPEVELSRIELTFWGVPADPSHDSMRGLICSNEAPGTPFSCHDGNQAPGVTPIPFLAMPTDCTAGPEVATLRADSWQEPGSVSFNGSYAGYSKAEATVPAVTGCDLLGFHPTIEVQTDTAVADEPVGLDVNIGVPQVARPGVLATPHLRNAIVTLPPGLSISPGVVDGIQACNASGPEGINFTGPESEEVGLNGELQLAPGHCPDASTVGTVEAVTPVLDAPLRGHVYLARPGCGGADQAACTEADALDGNLYQLYLELGGAGEFSNTGIVIKVAGKTEANPATGQLTTKFLENPQLPFNELKVHLNGGPRAPLDNPATCGPAVTTADFTPWSAPGILEGLAVPGTPDATPSSFFDVEGCASSPGLSPGFVTGTVSPRAGEFSSFTMNLTRQDREQFIKGVQVRTPPGLLGMLSSVPLCEEPLAASGHCPASSKIGTTQVASGAGSHPFEIGGDVYLTTGYGGAPFGLSIVTDAVAGPFNLGLVVVRARIAVNPVDSSLTITTDETGPYAIPQIVFGVPLRLQRVTVNIDRPGFMFNPTNCKAQQIAASISGTQNAVANVASPFAAGGCESLAFKPSFTVSASARNSRVDGASLDAKVTFPPFKAGSEANVAYVKVELPKQLPSRLTTLQKACLAATFEKDPAQCPPESIVGIARASTPVLPVPLSGPVYFVSHGGEAFPSLIVVLQGDGVRVDLTGSTFISKAGITSSTFKTVPDVPINSFELYLPEGRYSALGANGNLCKPTAPTTVRRKITIHSHGHITHKTIQVKSTKAASLTMPTEFIAQNGAALKQTTEITVTGCPKKASTSRPKVARRRTSKEAHP